MRPSGKRDGNCHVFANSHWEMLPALLLAGCGYLGISQWLSYTLYSKEHLKILKTTSGSYPRADLSNVIIFSPSQSHATVPLRLSWREKLCRLHRRSLNDNWKFILEGRVTSLSLTICQNLPNTGFLSFILWRRHFAFPAMIIIYLPLPSFPWQPLPGPPAWKPWHWPHPPYTRWEARILPAPQL